MATLTIEIGKKGKNKERAIYFLICHGKNKKRLPTGINVTDTELSSNGKSIKNLNKARLIEKARRELQDKLDEVTVAHIGINLSIEDIVAHLTRQSITTDFFTFADEWLATSTIKGKKNYVCCLNALEKFIGGRKLPFEQVTYGLLEGFERYLDCKPRAKSMYLGFMRHLYREAMRKYNTDYEQVIKNDPFLRYRVPKQTIKKGVRALTLEQMYKIADFRGLPGGRAQLARDCFLLSFCLMGMNSVDMFEAQDIKNNTIRYKRAKTRDRRSDEAYIEVRVHPYIAGLMKKYKGGKKVFCFSDRYSSPADFNRALNIGLKEVGKVVNIGGLQFYQARHTFATLSRNLIKVSKGDVDEALNHVGAYDIADIYIAKDFSVINENNFKLIDRVFMERGE